MITAISLQGFKSFADKARLDLGPGITAIIGPNGSGKSNVVEAMRWATHGARARELRAGRASELVFHGSGGKAPLGFAEVTLELRGLPTAARLNLARRVYRDGSAEQDLDGRPARARDIHGALRGSGLGPGGLAVIGQGEVSGVVQAEPRTLLGYLEEAADLSRLSAARDETHARLREADGSLDTLRLLEDELAQRVDVLAADARAARRARELALRELALRDALVRSRQEALAAEIETLRAGELQLAARSLEAAQALRQAQDEQEALREELAAATERRSAHRAALELLRAADEASRQAETYLNHLQGESSRFARERAGLELTAPDRAAPDLAALELTLRRTRDEAERLESECRSLERDLTRIRTVHAQASERLARVDAQQSTLRAEFERVEETLEQARLAREEARMALETAHMWCEAGEQGFEQLASGREAARSRLRDARSELQALSSARGPLQRERTRLDSLLASFARYGEGARNALKSGVPGIVGAVADLLEVPGDFETAVSAALGRRLEQVVVERAEVAREIIEHLKRVGGRATFLPLDLLRPRSRRDAVLLREPGVLGNLAELCPSAPAIVANVLLADSLLVQDARTATRLARIHAQRPRLVTLDGEVLEPGGALTGGRLRDSGTSHLADQRRLAELHDELASIESRERELGALLLELTAQLGELDTRYDALLRGREDAAHQERQREQQLSGAEAAVASAERTLDALRERLTAVPQNASSAAELPELAPREEALAALRVAAQTAREAERASQDAFSGARELTARWNTYRAALERAHAIDVRSTELGQATLHQRQLVQGARAEAARRRADLGGFDEGEVERLEQRRSQVTQRYTSLIGRQNRLRAELEEVRLTLARREAAVEDVPPGALLPGTSREWQSELTRVSRELAELGVVNARAETEYQSERQRLDALSVERQDAEDAAGELRRLLGEIERDAQAQLALAYARVQQAFVEYAGELLGGEGELLTERDERGYLVGLRLAVQPRGKRTRAMNLLSAGERTMAGLAFLFALGHATENRGLPLAVLDEVDAPLDEANIRRFTHFLQVFAARGAQFILVTHQKATMEVAHALWGVTTDSSGASRVLSIKHPSEAVASVTSAQ
ncbi:AAA family ATPase [Deinococcus peraridilitoris]|uniref:Chromosome partition protein Smc n=1 Tax=Deinococcus peraridilitoris (strain DSM 19664 / LMG 22246 / CIP 109416 / KR-200) TaxID=937777 RepID=L0A7J5_DEIPD|nr:chromosome segregation SMC family protein [Deinococcus peraridilitoris]AFZ69132.1 chromosome segregation ATPase [Deinococcus peraridilitoris DSM 19664]